MTMPDDPFQMPDIHETDTGMVTNTEHLLTDVEAKLIAALDRLKSASELAAQTPHKGVFRYGNYLWEVYRARREIADLLAGEREQ